MSDKIKFSKTEDTTSRLPFKPKDKYKNFVIGFIKEVTKSVSEKNDNAEWEFRGLETPRLALTFSQLVESTTDKPRFYVYGEFPQTVVKKNGERMADSTILLRYRRVWDKIKHIYDAFSDCPNWKPFPFDPEFDVTLDMEERLKEWDAFFDKIVKAFNKGKDGKTPIFPTTESESALRTMKVVSNGKRLTFPEFTGTGFIEKSIFVDGEFKTNLEFKSDETVIMADPSAPPASGIPDVSQGQFNKPSSGGSKLPDALRNAIK